MPRTVGAYPRATAAPSNSCQAAKQEIYLLMSGRCAWRMPSVLASNQAIIHRCSCLESVRVDALVLLDIRCAHEDASALVPGNSACNGCGSCQVCAHASALNAQYEATPACCVQTAEEMLELILGAHNAPRLSNMVCKAAPRLYKYKHTLNGNALLGW